MNKIKKYYLNWKEKVRSKRYDGKAQIYTYIKHVHWKEAQIEGIWPWTGERITWLLCYTRFVEIC